MQFLILLFYFILINYFSLYRTANYKLFLSLYTFVKELAEMLIINLDIFERLHTYDKGCRELIIFLN